MSDRIFVSAIGAVVEIDATQVDEPSRERIRDAWRDALHVMSDTAEPAATVATRGGSDVEAMLAALSTDVTLAALEQRRGELWMLHAAGLADQRGHVVVLCAPSGTGKTTAARHLSAHYTYVSDETVGIDSRGEVTAYRKPLSIIESGRATKNQVPPSQFEGGRQSRGPLRLSKIVILDRQNDGPEQPEIEHLDLVAALVLLTPQTSYLSDVPEALQMIASVLSATGGAMRVRYREAQTLDGILGELMIEEPSVSAPDLTFVSSARSMSDQHNVDHVGEARYSRATVVDTLELPGGKLAILQREESGGRLKVLDGIAPALWTAADGATFDALRARLVEVHGSPEGEDVNELVSAAVQDLVAEGVLRCSSTS